ncbi:hypothetical protein HUJ04_003187 [Dendroctonus ponderosae]|nr:hypothetical protein HUJ04_003187 [Dendroctonus ponderosae]
MYFWEVSDLPRITTRSVRASKEMSPQNIIEPPRKATWGTRHVLEDDSLPKQVCSQCEVNIFNTYNFLQQCKKSDSLLQTIITDANIKLESRHPHIHIASANSTLEPSMDVSNIFNSSNLGQETDDQNDTDNFENEVNTVSEVVEQPMKKIVILIDQHESYNNISDNFEEVYINSPYTFNENQINFSHYNDNRGIKELNIQKSNIPLEDETMQPFQGLHPSYCYSFYVALMLTSFREFEIIELILP